MSNKMLIDASHPEETRVTVVRGNRIEEFDFESQEKKQLRGNIYLAKVTRVEPSLQAAFIDYGGNRHGFLAFSEIHPDYYQIPVADRQALLEAEAAEARAARDSEEAKDDLDAIADDGDDRDDGEEASPPEKKKPRRRRTRKAKSDDATASESGDGSSDEDGDQSAVEASLDKEASASKEAVAEEAPSEPEDKPKRKTTRRRTSRKKADDGAEASASDDKQDAAQTDSPDTDDDTGPSSTMAAIIETDSISEPLPEDGDDNDRAEDTSSDDTANTAEEAAPKKRRATRTRRKPKKADADAAEEATAENAADDDAASGDDAQSSQSSGEKDEPDEKPAKPKSRSRRRSSSARKDKSDNDGAEDDDDAANGEGDAPVESVGQADALEEVPAPRRARRHYKIQEVIKRRQVLLVQVVKEERGTKGAALTTYLSLAGRYSVLMPNTARGGGISRKITNSSDRKRLKAIAEELEVPNGMGVILRTAGASRTKDEINRDFEYLMRLWGQVRNLTLSSTAPCLVYEEGSLIKRSIRDLYDKDTGEIVVAGEAGYNEAKDFMTMLMPSHANRVKLHQGSQSIFAKFGVESHLEKMLSPQVTLKSGGYLIINQTEALVAVDVNSGRSTREHSVENTALQTNLEAAEEVARQLRLRDLAGLIVIDFIDMEERRNNRSVEKKLKDCLKNDRARIQVGRISHFGLMEMSRQRMRASVLESTMDVCSHCAGTGYVRSDSAIALHVFRAIEEHVSRHNRFDCVVKTTPSIAIHILNHKRAALLALEEKYGLHVIIEGDPEISGQEFNIEKGDEAQGGPESTAIAYQNDAANDAATSDDEDAGDNNQKRRGRRRRGKDDSSEDDGQDQTAETKGSDNSEDDEQSEKGGRKRRRGRRGGKKPRADDTTSDDSGSDDNGGDAEPVKTAAKSAPKKAETAPADTEEEASQEPKKSRSTVRRKAPVAPKSDNAADKAEVQAEKPADDDAKPKEPPRPARRRTTRRSSESSTAPAPVAASSEDTANSGPQSEGEEGSQTGEDGKKTGWWQRGGGFF